MTRGLLGVGVEAAAVLAELHARCFPVPWDAAAFAGLVATPGVAARLAVRDGSPAGFVLWRIAADEAEIVTLGVAPDCRRLGLGRLLLRGAEEAALCAGARRMVFEVGHANAPALALYAGAGYAPVGRRPGYYGAAGGDAVLLARDLAATERKDDDQTLRA